MNDVKFFRVSHNTFGTRGFPWISTISEGLKDTYRCYKCGRVKTYAEGDITGILEKEKGTKWSDVLGCGHFPLFIISSRILEAFDKEQLLTFPYHRVFIEKPYPKRLDEQYMPDYYWVDGLKMLGAELDFEASRFVDNTFCSECGTRTYNIEKTFELQDKGFSYIFKKDTWNGSNLFVTELSHTALFCTDKIFECAKKYKLTNFKFTPIEDGNNLTGIKYLK